MVDREDIKPKQLMLQLTHTDSGVAAYVPAKVKGSSQLLTVNAAALERQLGKLVRLALPWTCSRPGCGDQSLLSR
jgi:hypothetical protein